MKLSSVSLLSSLARVLAVPAVDTPMNQIMYERMMNGITQT